MHGATPVLRIFDEDKAREFYLGLSGMGEQFRNRTVSRCPGLVRH